MARKPRMGRNLNALLGSVVKERREQSEERAATEADATSREGVPANDAGGSAEVTTLPYARSPRTSPASDGIRPMPASPDPVSSAPLSPDSGSPAPGPDGAPRADGSDEDGGHEQQPFPVLSEPAVEVPDDSPNATPAVVPSASPDAVSPSGAVSPADATSPAGAVSSPAVAPRAPAGDPAPVPAPALTSTSVSASTSTDALAAEDEGTAGSGAVLAASGAVGDPPRPGDRLRMIGVERIRRGVFQPRRFFDQEALQELADSLKAQGMIQPVIVRPFGGAFELIAGERRWRAAQMAGFAEIPAIVREMEDRTVAAVSLIENIQREDLNPLEEAQALTRLCDEFGMTHASVAESIGRSRAAVSNLMRLLDLHDEVKVLVDKGELDMGHARALLRVPKVDQPALALRVAKQGLTVRAVEKLIRTSAEKGATPPAADRKAVDPDVERLEERLSGLLGASVSIRHKADGGGRLEIGYASLDELDGILAHIR